MLQRRSHLVQDILRNFFRKPLIDIHIYSTLITVRRGKPGFSRPTEVKRSVGVFAQVMHSKATI